MHVFCCGGHWNGGPRGGIVPGGGCCHVGGAVGILVGGGSAVGVVPAPGGGG